MSDNRLLLSEQCCFREWMPQPFHSAYREVFKTKNKQNNTTCLQCTLDSHLSRSLLWPTEVRLISFLWPTRLPTLPLLFHTVTSHLNVAFKKHRETGRTFFLPPPPAPKARLSWAPPSSTSPASNTSVSCLSLGKAPRTGLFDLSILRSFLHPYPHPRLGFGHLRTDTVIYHLSMDPFSKGPESLEAGTEFCFLLFFFSMWCP